MSVFNSATAPRQSSSGADGIGPVSTTFTPQNYAAGRVLSGRFRVEHLIGVGSMGVVLAARHIELDTRVAIKAIRPEVQALPGVVSRFAREAKAAVAIRSEHVARVIDVGTADDLGPFIVMEYLEGRDLRALLELDGKVPERRAADYLLQACEALAAAHAQGIIHRDIKPENLFLTRHGDLEVLKLLDFGISKVALTGRLFGDELSAEEKPCLMGTPLYMSPEQIHSMECVDHRSDIWSLGAVLYELVSGRNAFSASSVHELLKNILELAPMPLDAHGARVDPALWNVIERCLEKDPARRFQNVAELAIALMPFASARAHSHAQRAASILGLRFAGVAPPAQSPAPEPAAPEAPAAARAVASGTPLRSHLARGMRGAVLVSAALVGAVVLLSLGSEPTPRAAAAPDAVRAAPANPPATAAPESATPPATAASATAASATAMPQPATPEPTATAPAESRSRDGLVESDVTGPRAPSAAATPPSPEAATAASAPGAQQRPGAERRAEAPARAPRSASRSAPPRAVRSEPRAAPRRKPRRRLQLVDDGPAVRLVD